MASKSTEGDPSLVILLLGNPGIGKSTLVNKILGSRVAKTSLTGQVLRKGLTRAVKDHSDTINDVSVTVYDTPGLLESATMTTYTIEEVKKVLGNVDIVLFCFNINQTRLHDNCIENQMIKAITEGLNKEIWRKTVVTLLQANIYIDSLRRQGKPEDYIEKTFKDTLVTWNEFVCTSLHSLQADMPDVKVTFAGLNNEALLRSHKKSWLSELFQTCVTKLPEDKLAAIGYINIDRLITKVNENGITKTVRISDIVARRANSGSQTPEGGPRAINLFQTNRYEHHHNVQLVQNTYVRAAQPMPTEQNDGGIEVEPSLFQKLLNAVGNFFMKLIFWK